MDHFFVIANQLKDPDLTTTNLIKNYLEEKGKVCYVQDDAGHSNGRQFKYTDASRIPPEVECVLVLGGDGTFCRPPGIWWIRGFPFLASTWAPWDIWRRSNGRISGLPG